MAENIQFDRVRERLAREEKEKRTINFCAGHALPEDVNLGDVLGALETAANDLGDAADRLHKIAECLNALSGEGFENSATQVLAAAGIVRQYEANARIALAKFRKEPD